jgi:endonuclease/exonuclease/phosphatase family metal-dependent hydrolase
LHPVFERNITFQGGDYGNAVLSRLPVASWRNVPLPSHYEGEQRGALVLELTAPGDLPLRFIATHFDSRPDDAERLDSVKTLEAIVAEKPDVPTLLAGDLNARPDSRTLAALSPHWAGAGGAPLPTFPSAQPTRQIDYVLARPAKRWKVVESRVLDEPIASDHRPLLVVLELETMP